MELRKLVPEEIRRVVTAVCDADEQDRKDVGRDAAERVASKVSSDLSYLERMRDEAYRYIDEVLGDAELKDKHDSAKRLREELAERWKSIENMAKNAMRGGNHPIVSFMALKGIEEHQNYQRNSSNCHAYEFETGSRRADCLRADGDTCYVVELKPRNSRAIGSGMRQAQDSVDDLSKELAKMAKGEGSRVMQDLISKRSDFGKCKQWQRKVRCYTLCPEVNDEGEFRESSARWDDC
ncbi:MAG: hypothetical protein HC774_08210 [Sphingomonadales bacterium]|nr:hypothetical protein [Sphingomonadales bacterium]